MTLYDSMEHDDNKTGGGGIDVRNMSECEFKQGWWQIHHIKGDVWTIVVFFKPSLNKC